MWANPTLNMSFEKHYFHSYFHIDVGHMTELVVFALFETKNVYIIFYFYIISTILTLDVPSAKNNSTIECYKTFMFGQKCTKIKTPTSSMVKN
jgi:hypothetical protein